MNKALFAAGVGALAVGGVAYWYLTQKREPPVPCRNYTDFESCSKAGCYWYDGKCHVVPESERCVLLPGDDPGYGYPHGWLKCDPMNKLCRWDDINKYWICVKKDSVQCATSYRKCYVSTATGYIVCSESPGIGTNECRGSASENCGCITGTCKSPTYCCPDNVCRLSAYNDVIDANQTNMTCDDSDEGNHFCTYSLKENLGRSLVATTLIGSLDYYWGPWPGSFGTFRIWSWYAGVKTLLYENTAVWLGSEGKLTPEIPIFSGCIDALQFNLACWGTNIHINKFIGHLSY